MQPEKIEEEKVEVTYKDTFRFIWHYSKDNMKLAVGAVVLIMFAEFATAITPVYVGKMVDALNQGGANAWNDVWLAFWFFLGLKVLSNCFGIASYFCAIPYEVNTMSKIIQALSFKIQRFSSEWHLNSFGGATVRYISRGQWSFHTISDGITMNIIPTMFLVIGLVVMLCIKVPAVGLVMGLVTIIFIAVNVYFSITFLSPKFKKSTDKDSATCALLGDVVTANQVVKSFGAEKKEDEKVNSIVEAWRKYTISAWCTGVAFSGSRHFVSTIITGLVTGMVIFSWRDGNATVGDIAVVISAVGILFGKLHTIGRIVEGIQRACNEIEDAVAIWLREDDVRDVEDAVPLVLRDDHKRNKIAFEGVGFIYPKSDVGLFKGLSLKIPDGEHVALVGTSGSGKSTFIKLLQRLYNINEGQVRIDGQDISKVTLESLRQSISLVPQDPILFHRSLKENIAYGKPDALMEEIIEASKKAYIYEFISKLPEGFDTEVGERGIKLSGGERQRVAIARAILADKPILVLDEATSSLDSVSEQYIKDAMEELVKGKTTITIAHRLSTVRKSDRILVFSKGKIIEQGKHDELMADTASKYKKLYDTQSLGIVIRDNDDEVKK